MITTIERRVGILGAVSMLAACLFIGGCNAETKLTPKEQANIKGNGQMPPEAQAKLASRLQQANQKMQQSQPSPGR